MFDFSFSELIIIALAALLLIGPEELPGVIRNTRKIIARIKEMAKEFTSAFAESGIHGDLKNEVKKLNQDIRTIIDLDGKEQPAYDISDLREEIEKTRQDKKNPQPQTSQE